MSASAPGSRTAGRMLLATAAVLLAGGTAGGAGAPSTRLDPRLPVYFVATADPRLAFQSVAGATPVAFAERGPRFVLEPSGTDRGGRLWVVAAEFVGARRGLEPEGTGRSAARVSRFKGHPGEWKTGLAAYTGIAYREVWKGIDVHYAGPAGRIKSTFTVQPGADPRRIRVAVRGASSLRVRPSGELKIGTPAGTLVEAPPEAYQERGGERVPVTAAYQVMRSRATLSYRFRLGPVDPSLPLVIDPVVLAYCGYVGGSADDLAGAVALDASGNAYIAGRVSSTESTFPVVVGPDPSYNGGLFDAFVAKVRADGSGLVYAGYIGGNGTEQATGIAVDAAGNAYVTGYTSSTELSFPVLGGPDLSSGGGWDAFVAKVRADGTGLEYAGFIGGAGDDQGWAIAVDAAGSAFVTGNTASSETSFPVAVGPDLTYGGGGTGDAFVAKVAPDGSGLAYAGYIGGSDFDNGRGIALDAAGSAFVVGSTSSSQLTFPVAVGPDLVHNGGVDAFVAKVRADGAVLVYAGYIGGSGADNGSGIAVDAAGGAYVAGRTTSVEANFPVAVGPDLAANGLEDAFVAKVRADGAVLEYAGFIGGANADQASGIAVDATGAAVVAGSAGSAETTFPVLGGPDLSHGGGASDAFVAKIQADGSGLLYCGYVGGAMEDRGGGIAVDAAGNATLVGLTYSPESSLPVTVGPDLTFNGVVDGFVARVTDSPDPPGPCCAGGTCTTRGQRACEAAGGIVGTCAAGLACGRAACGVSPIQPIQRLKCVKTGSDVRLSWDEDANSDRYLGSYVTRKDLIPVGPFTGLAPFSVSTVAQNQDAGAVPGAGGSLRCYGVAGECPVVQGACCPAGSGGTCVVQLRADCQAAGGTWAGGPCTGVDCTTGACCPENGSSCREQIQQVCEGAGGTFFGGSCAGLDCATLGACCPLGGGSCQLHTRTDCEDFGGSYLGHHFCTDVDCATVGSCCGSDATCRMDTTRWCHFFGGWAVGSSCTPDPCRGACCQLGSCELNNQLTCSALGGTWVGQMTCAGVDCGSVGACCSGSPPACALNTRQACLTGGGTYLASASCLGVDCSTGACCPSGGGACQVQTPDDCRNGNGVYLGAGCTGVDCAAGACCDTFGGCSLTAAVACPPGSIWQGGGTTCATALCQLGACCQRVPAGECTDNLFLSCQSLGTWLGNVPCGTPWGACCHGQDCQVTSEGCCMGGTFLPGVPCPPSGC